MGFRILMIVATLGILPAKAEVSPRTASASEVTRMVETLGLVPSGKLLLDRAVKAWKLKNWNELQKKVSLGQVSRTDAVLTRHFNSADGTETRERNVTVTIRAAQPFGERVLDFAHELTHAVAEPAWDPYDPELTAGKYVHASLESPGGEIEAVYIECAVAKELSDLGQELSPRCDRYFAAGDEKAKIDRDLVRKDFYRVGKWKNGVLKKLGAEATLFPLLSGNAPELYSATGGAPYPVSLLREYEELNRIACQNAERRLRSGRSPANASTSALLQGRCRSNSSDREMASTQP